MYVCVCVCGSRLWLRSAIHPHLEKDMVAIASENQIRFHSLSTGALLDAIEHAHKGARGDESVAVAVQAFTSYIYHHECPRIARMHSWLLRRLSDVVSG